MLVLRKILPFFKQFSVHPLGQAILCAAALALVRYFPFFVGKTLFFGDNYTLLAVGKIWSAEWLKQGVYALWNPFLFSGLSWVGDISQSLLSFAAVPFLVLPPTAALNAAILMHFVFTFIGMYLLTRSMTRHHWWSLTAAGLWSVSSLWTGAANNLATLQSLSWFPWVLWAGFELHWQTGAVVRLTAVIAGMVTAGYPQHLLVVLPVSFLISWAKSSAKWWELIKAWFVSVLAAFGLTAPLSLPFLAALSDSTRQIMSAEQAARGSFHPAELIKIFLPNFFDAPRFGIRWGPNWNFFPTNMPYFSSLGLIILLTTSWKKLLRDRLVRVLFLACAGGFLLSLGSHIPGYLELLRAVPVLAMVRYPSTWLFVPELFGLVLMAYAAKTWRPPEWLKLWLPKIRIVVLAASGIAAAALFFHPEAVWRAANTLTMGVLAKSAFHTWQRDQYIGLMIVTNIAVSALFLGFAWRSILRKNWPLAAACMVMEGLIASQAMLLFAPASIYVNEKHFENMPQVTMLQDPQYRVITRNGNHPYTDFGSYWEAVAVRPPFSDSFVDKTELASASHLARLRDGFVFDWNIVAGVPLVNGYTTLLPIDYQNIWQTSEETRVNLLDQIAIDNPLLAQWAVKYYVVDTWFTISEEEQAYLATLPLAAEHGSLRIYELPALSRFRFENDMPVSLLSLTEDPNGFSLVFENTYDNEKLVVADRFEAGWKAFINSREVLVENKNGMRSIPIERGHNMVEMRYAPASWQWGWRLFFVTLISGSVYLLVFFLKKRQLSKN